MMNALIWLFRDLTLNTFESVSEKEGIVTTKPMLRNNRDALNSDYSTQGEVSMIFCVGTKEQSSFLTPHPASYLLTSKPASLTSYYRLLLSLFSSNNVSNR